MSQASTSSAALAPPSIVRAHHTNSSISAQSEESQESFYDTDASFAAEEDQEEVAPVSRAAAVLVLDAVDLAREQEAQLDQIAGLFACTRRVASTLLRQYHWKVERLIEAFYEDETKVLAKAGLAGTAFGAKRQRSDDSSDATSKRGGSPSSAAGAPAGAEAVAEDVTCGECEVTCGVCFEDFAAEETSALETCGHAFCNGCWRGHLDSLHVA